MALFFVGRILCNFVTLVALNTGRVFASKKFKPKLSNGTRECWQMASYTRASMSSSSCRTSCYCKLPLAFFTRCARYGKISTDPNTAWLSLNAHFGRLGFSSLSGALRPALQIGAEVILHDLEVSELNGAFGVVNEEMDDGKLGVKITGPAGILQLFSTSQAGMKRWSGCLRVRPENCKEHQPKHQNILFLNPDKMLNPFKGNSASSSSDFSNSDSIFFQCGDGDDYNHCHACLYNSDLEDESSDEDD
jgi:hypothetical protein